MMNKKKWLNDVWAIFTLVIAMTGCNGTPDMMVLDEIYALDSVMIAGLEHPDSLPATLDSLRQQSSAVPDTAVADLSFGISSALLQEKQFTQLKTYNEQIQPLLASITVHGNAMKEREVSMNINVAEIFYYLGMYERFTQMLLHEYKTALINNQHNNQCNILGDLGVAYNEKRQYDKAIYYFDESIQFIDTVHASSKLVETYDNIAWAYCGRKDYNKALEYMMLAIHQIPTNDTTLRYHMDFRLAYMYYAMQQYPLSLKQIDSVFDWFEANSDHSTFVGVCNLKAEIYWKIGDLSQARYWFDRTIELIDYMDPRSKAVFAKNYASFCEELGDKDAVIKAMRQAYQVNEDIINGTNEGEALTALYDEELKQSETNQAQYEDSVMRYVWIAVGMGVLTLLALGVWAWLYWRQLKQKQGVEDERDELQQRLIATSAQGEKNREFLTTLGEELQDLQKTVPDGNKQDILKNLRTITSHVMGMAEDDNSAMQRANNDFFKRLLERYPQLTPNDLRLAALLRQGLSSKEISEITFREPRSIDMARSRLRKKIGLPKEQDLVTFFAAI